MRMIAAKKFGCRVAMASMRWLWTGELKPESGLYAARVLTLAAFWNSFGPASAEELVEVLVAAYKLGDPEEFANVLCEVSTPDCGSTLDIVTKFVERIAA